MACRASITVALLLCSTAGARAQAHGVELSWDAPPACPDEAAVRAEAERVLGSLDDDDAPLSARATVTRRGDRYALTLSTQYRGQQGERTLEAADCRALVQSVTLVLGVLLGRGAGAPADPEPGAAGSQPSDDGVPDTGDATGATRVDPEPGASEATATQAQEPQDAPRTASEPASEPPPRDRAHVDDTLANGAHANTHEDGGDSADEAGDGAPGERPARAAVDGVSLLLGAGVQPGLLPEPAVDGVVGVELGIEPFWVGLHLHGWLPQRQSAGDGVRAKLDGAGLTLLGCRAWGLAVVGAGVCVGGRMAALRGRASGDAAEPGSALAPWYALSAGGYLAWPRGAALRLRLSAEAAVSLARPRFVIDGLGDVHRVPPLVGDITLGVAWSP